MRRVERASSAYLIETRPFHGIPRRHREPCPQIFLCPFNVLGCGHGVEVDVDVTGQVAIVVPDHLRRFAHCDVGNLPERDGTAIGRDDRRLPDFGQRVHVFG